MSGGSTARLVVGVDVGASKIASGLVEPSSGRILASDTVPTPALGAVPDHVEVVSRAAERMLGEAGHRPVEGVGVGVCELVDPDGRIRSASSVELRGERLRDRLSRGFPEVTVDADVRNHALAELVFGRGADDFAFVSAGTGVSSCLVIGGIPRAGARGNALVLGSGRVTVRCPSCGVEIDHILEDTASGRAIAASWGADRAEEVFDAAVEGDERARRILRDAAIALGSAVAFLANVTDPGEIVVGGGMAGAPGPFWGDVEREMRVRIWSEGTRALPFGLSELGPEAGVLGAACSLVRRGDTPRRGSGMRRRSARRDP